MSEKRQIVKEWYDGFVFGEHADIYNPWSITNYLDKKKIYIYWANTSSNSMAGELIRHGIPEIKEAMENLLSGKEITLELDEQIIYNQLENSISAIWSLLLASGYLRIVKAPKDDPEDEETLSDTVEAAHKQIEEKKYDAPLLAEGISAERIHKYGFAFEGKKVLIG